jgi:hypothetical protein
MLKRNTLKENTAPKKYSKRLNTSKKLKGGYQDKKLPDKPTWEQLLNYPHLG